MAVSATLGNDKKTKDIPLTHNYGAFSLSRSDASLDLLSTSQTKSIGACEDSMTSDLCSKNSDTKNNPDNPIILNAQCMNFAPYFAIPIGLTDKKFYLWQGNCNDWNCPRCGILRAKKEYGRIVEGCRTLAKDYPLYFLTVSCRGKDMPLAEANENYGTWTNRLLTACRTEAKRGGKPWHYAQVTEKQKRQHPHSHILATYEPKEIYDGKRKKYETMPDGSKRMYFEDCLRSDWFEKRCISAGLGEQYDISKVDTVEGASRYVAKYLFKETMFSTRWKKNWKRVRYSNSFPKLPERETTGKAFPLITTEDWNYLAKRAIVVKVEDGHDYIHLSQRLGKSDTVIQLIKTENNEQFV